MTRFFCITEPRLETTNALLRAACEARGVVFVEVDWRRYDEDAMGRPRRGDLIYRPAVAYGASQIEQLLWRDGVAAFYDTPESPSGDQRIAYARAGIPIPQTEYAISDDREALRRRVEKLGGFPVILKAPGFEGGAGTIYIPAWPTLFSVVDHVGSGAVLQRFIDHAVCYRLVLVGRDVVAADASYPAADDFRSNAYGGVIGAVTPPPRAVRMARQAADVLKVEFGGADILETADGDLYLAEFNSPCYFPGTQEKTGVDIAGAMVDWLLGKARKSKRPAPFSGAGRRVSRRKAD